MAVTIATGALIACSDAAVDEVTAPPLAAKPAASVANRYPYAWELIDYAIPSAIGIQISANPGFQDNYQIFSVTARYTFQWANDVTGNLNASLINRNGTTINSGSAGFTWKRLALPVPYGDTTLTVRLSTNGITCGLIGKSSYSGSAAQIALNVSLLQISLYHQSVANTSATDVMQPACPPPPGCEEAPANRVLSGTTGILASEGENCGDAPAPPGGGGDDDFEVCYTVWRELWIWDYLSRTYTLSAEWIIGTYCYAVTYLT